MISTRNLERFDAEVSVGVDLKRRPVSALRSGSERECGAFLHGKGVKVSVGRACAVENTEKSDRFLGVLRVVRCCLSVQELVKKVATNMALGKYEPEALEKTG